MPFRKVENCNQVIKIGKQLKFSLVNVAGNDIVQGNKKLKLGKHVSLFQGQLLLLFLFLVLFYNVIVDLFHLQLFCGS